MEERKTRPLPDNVAHWKQLKQADLLGAWDLQDEKPVKVQIDSVQQEELFNTGNNKKEWKTVARFKGTKKGLVLNATNMDAIASLHGNNPKDWLGKEVELIKSMTKLRGVPTECIRVKGKSKGQSAADSVK